MMSLIRYFICLLCSFFVLLEQSAYADVIIEIHGKPRVIKKIHRQTTTTSESSTNSATTETQLEQHSSTTNVDSTEQVDSDNELENSEEKDDVSERPTESITDKIKKILGIN